MRKNTLELRRSKMQTVNQNQTHHPLAHRRGRSGARPSRPPPGPAPMAGATGGPRIPPGSGGPDGHRPRRHPTARRYDGGGTSRVVFGCGLSVSGNPRSAYCGSSGPLLSFKGPRNLSNMVTNSVSQIFGAPNWSVLKRLFSRAFGVPGFGTPRGSCGLAGPAAT